MFEMTKLNKTVLKTSKIVNPFWFLPQTMIWILILQKRWKLSRKMSLLILINDDAEDAISVMFDKHNY